MALPILPILAALPSIIGALKNVAGSVVSSGSTLVVAVVAAVPPTISAVADLLDKISKSPMLAFLFGAILLAPVGFKYGLSWDKPLRDKAITRAIKDANQKADLAIANNKQHYEAQLAELRKQLAAKQTPATTRKR